MSLVWNRSEFQMIYYYSKYQNLLFWTLYQQITFFSCLLMDGANSFVTQISLAGEGY